MNNKSALVINSSIVLGMLLLSAALPESQSIPVHYGIDGTPDQSALAFF